MNKKCIGCGSILQTNDKSIEGYIREGKLENSLYCERCFKLKNYGEVNKSDIKVNAIECLKELNKNKKRIIYLVDILNITPNIKEHLEYINESDYILLTKIDVLPKSVKENKLIEYFKDNYKNIKNIFCISSLKKINIEYLINKLNHDSSKEFYLAGNSNAGKSSLLNTINKLIGNGNEIVISRTLNTTIKNIEFKINENLTIVDTPGFNNVTIEDYLSVSDVKKLTIKKTIKPSTIQIKPNCSLYIDKYVRVDHLGEAVNSFTLYMSNALNTKLKKIVGEPTDLDKIKLNLNKGEDIVINGLGFIKVVKPCEINVYTFSKEIVSVRKNII